MPLTPQAADKLISENFPALPAVSVPLEAANRRILRQDLRADRDQPPYNRVTMDGYALRSLDIIRGGRKFRSHAFQAAGKAPVRLDNTAFSCIEVATGAVLPEGADAVVPYELTRRNGDFVELADTCETVITSGYAVHPRASDCITGSLLVESGLRLGAKEAAAAATLGYMTVKVAAQPRIHIISTGDELVGSGGRCDSWQIRRSNDSALKAALISTGFTDVQNTWVPDSEEALANAVSSALESADCILTTGSASLGKTDVLAKVLGWLGVRSLFHGLSQKPGKPLYFGLAKNGVPIFGLPGNPVSCFTLLHRFVLPALLRASGAKPTQEQFVALSEHLDCHPQLTLYVPVKLETAPGGAVTAYPHFLNTSGDFTGLLQSDGFIELPAGQPTVEKGGLVQFRAWL